MSRRTAPRGGFTLIELLVVIAIIAILVGLTSAAVMRVRISAKRAAAKADIAQVTNAISSYKARMNAQFIPSGFVVRNDYTTAAALADVNSVASANYLKSVFPGMNLTATGLGTAYGGDGTALDCNQTLNLFLTGGLATNYQGFSTNRSAPFTMPVTGEQRLGPFFEIKGSKVDPKGHLLDEYGTPYAYFVHNPAGGVGTYMTATFTWTTGTVATTLSPYQSSASPPRFYEPNGFQIVSAGPNGLFGPGGYWQAGQGVYVEGGIGGDDLSNFNTSPLLTQN